MRLQSRPGAILPLVAVLLVLLLSFFVVVFDMTRLHAQKAELQTSADAASLAGAIQLYLGDTLFVPAIGQTYASLNPVQQASIPAAGVAITCGYWNDTTAVFTPSVACGRLDNAVEATVTDTTRYVLPAILSASRQWTSATARAWIAHVGRTSCVKPWGIDYRLLTERLDPAGDPLRDLTAEDLANLKTMTPEQLGFHLKGGEEVTPGNLGALRLGGNGGNVYRNNILTCNTMVIGPGDVVQLQPGDVGGPTIQGLAGHGGSPGLCSPLSPLPVDSPPVRVCYNSSGAVGVDIKAVFYLPPPGCSGACDVTVRIVGSFAVDSVYDYSDDPDKPIELFGHFVSVLSDGGVSGTPSTVSRPILTY